MPNPPIKLELKDTYLHKATQIMLYPPIKWYLKDTYLHKAARFMLLVTKYQMSFKQMN